MCAVVVVGAALGSLCKATVTHRQIEGLGCQADGHGQAEHDGSIQDGPQQVALQAKRALSL